MHACRVSRWNLAPNPVDAEVVREDLGAWDSREHFSFECAFVVDAETVDDC